MSDIHSKSIAERIDWLLELAHRHGNIFRSPEAWLSRERYLSEHPTAIAVLKCMDGRIVFPALQPECYATNLAHWPKKCPSIPQCSTGVHAAWN